jgi:S-DNA-T family DNA segregation ATPase FtsK/SpoIIIE
MGKPASNRRLPEKKKREKPSARGKAPSSGLARDVGAVVLLALGAALGLALATWSSFDAALIARGYTPSNLCGPVGHRVASVLYGVLGLASLVLPFGLTTAAWKLFRGAPPRLTVVSSLAYLALTAASAALCHLAIAGTGVTPFPAGGAVGARIAAPSVSLFSTWGSALLLAAAAFVALILAADVKPRNVAASLAALGLVLWRGVAAVGGWLSEKVADSIEEHRAAVAELREEEAERARREAEEAEALADTAEIEALGPEDVAEARAVANALALEEVRRSAFDEPAWAAPRGGDDESVMELGALAEEKPRRARKKARDPGPEEQEGLALDLADPPEAELEMPAVAPSLGRPEIVLNPAMLPGRGPHGPSPELVEGSGSAGRGAPSPPGKKRKKDVPEFAFQKAGDVFRLPGTALLDVHEEKAKVLDEAALTRTSDVIVATLKQHGIDGVIRHIRPGPVVTLYEFSPVAGVKLARIENLDKELTMALSAMRLRIIAPIPGKGVVGIEVPNRDRATVYLRDVLESEAFAQAGGILPFGLGKNIEGVPYCLDLQRMPHLLIAGTTGSGKSVGLNTMILSLLYRQTPAEVRMIMVDPKMTELSAYEDIPHLLLPVVTDSQKAARALQWAVDEMERRTQILADTGSKDLRSYNSKVEKLRAEGRTFEDQDEATPHKKLMVVDATAGETEEDAAARAAQDVLVPSAEFEDPTAPPPHSSLETQHPVAARDEKRLPQKLPYVVVVIDELADLMMTAPREVEISLARLAQKARATGIHLIVATQRPSTDVITGMIKNNFPARISFRLASRHDSQTIINGPGAESLLGDGDMLVLTATQPVTRVQGAFVSEEELHRVVKFLKEQGKPVYDENILKARDGNGAGAGYESDEEDSVYDQAIDLVSRMEEVSVSKLQREMRLGYNKAAKIVERMEREGLVGPANGVKPRRVLIGPVGEVSPVPNL